MSLWKPANILSYRQTEVTQYRCLSAITDPTFVLMHSGLMAFFLKKKKYFFFFFKLPAYFPLPAQFGKTQESFGIL